MNDLVSIIIPLYNKEKFICEAIESALNQTYQNVELIIVDDISTDCSVEIVKNYQKYDKRIKLIKLKRKGKAAGARNEGIKQAQGNFICFLDADDLWTKDKIQKQLLFMKEKNCAFSFTGYEFTDESGKLLNKQVFIPSIMNYYQALKNTTIWTTTVMFDMSKISKEKIYMPSVPSEDTATWWKILRNGYEAYGLNEILAYYRRSKGTLSANKIEAVRRIWYLYINQEGLNIFSSFYYFTCYVINALKRRI